MAETIIVEPAEQVENTTLTIVHQDSETLSISVADGSGPPGPPGPAGPAGSPATDSTGTAGASVSGHRVVTVDGSGLIVHCSDIYGIGISTGAAAIGAEVTYRSAGVIDEPSWTWTTKGPIYQGADGTLTQSAPSSGFVRQVGLALSPTSMLVDLQPPIVI